MKLREHGPTAFDRAAQFVQLPVDLDPALADGYATLGRLLHRHRGPVEAVQAFERAFVLNPSPADGRCASSLAHSGRAAEAMGDRHCASCRAWSAGPVNAFVRWKPQAVAISKGAARGKFSQDRQKPPQMVQAVRRSPVTEHPKWGVVDVYAAVLPQFKFRPAGHVNYQETVLPIRHRLPKQQDLAAEMGGSGVLMQD